jgi:hypothetical protein
MLAIAIFALAIHHRRLFHEMEAPGLYPGQTNACPNLPHAYEDAGCCTEGVGSTIVNFLAELLEQVDPLKGVKYNETNWPPSKLHDDEVVPEAIEMLNLLRSPALSNNTEHCWPTLYTDKHNCFPKILHQVDIGWIGYAYTEEDIPTFRMLGCLPEDGPSCNSDPMFWWYWMETDSTGKVGFLSTPHASVYRGYMFKVIAQNSWSLYNSYFALDSNENTIIKQMTAAQIAEHGDCTLNIQDHTDSYKDPSLAGQPMDLRMGQKIWAHTYCMKNGVLSSETGYIRFFLGDMWTTPLRVNQRVVTSFPELGAYKGAVIDDLKRMGGISKDYDLVFDNYHMPEGSLQELFCGCAAYPTTCHADCFQEKRSEWFTHLTYLAQANGYLPPANLTAY